MGSLERFLQTWLEKKRKESASGWNWRGGAIRVDGERVGRKRKGIPPPPTFQPWLHLWCEPEEKTVYLRTWELWLTADDSCEFRTPILSPARAAAAAASAAGARHCKPLCRFFAYFRLGGRLKCGSFAPTPPRTLPPRYHHRGMCPPPPDHNRNELRTLTVT